MINKFCFHIKYQSDHPGKGPEIARYEGKQMTMINFKTKFILQGFNALRIMYRQGL